MFEFPLLGSVQELLLVAKVTLQGEGGGGGGVDEPQRAQREGELLYHLDLGPGLDRAWPVCVCVSVRVCVCECVSVSACV